ncbi:hypothetical protein QCD79_34250, partial [Pseudomonas quasicaspiana]|nr:hypothetical protein [Pseudomonas quasicaspiana]
ADGQRNVTDADAVGAANSDGRDVFEIDLKHCQIGFRVIGNDPETDLAVLKIDLKNIPSITIGRSDSIRIGDV